MKYSLTINSDDPQELVSLIAGNAEPATKDKKPAGKKPIVPVPEDDSEPDEEDDLVGSSDDDEITFESLQEKVTEKAQAGKRDAVKKALTKLGATKLTELDKSKYSDFDAALDKIK